MSETKTKRLYLVRHADAASNASDDKSRPLSPKGVVDAAKAGIFLEDKRYFPSMILCSPAKRTRETWSYIKQSIGNKSTQFLDILYSGTTGDYFNLIQKSDENIHNIMIIGHNPSIYGLVSKLAEDGSDSAMQRLSQGSPPASISVIECTCEKWKDLQPHKNILLDYANPLDFNAPNGPSKWM